MRDIADNGEMQKSTFNGDTQKSAFKGEIRESTAEREDLSSCDITTSGSGTLYVVATPIGNLEDITFRAVRILNQVALIAAEDTRHTLKLLSHYQINTKVVSCHEHNEESRIDMIVAKLSEGADVALVSDAGTPLISDPGYRVVKGVVEAGFKVIPIPGACAAIAGLSVSALPTDSFIFKGFPNKRQGKRIAELQRLKGENSTIIFYESPHRVVRLLEDILSVMGDRPAMVAREITKHYEEYIRGSLSYIITSLRSRPSIKGECAVFTGWSDKFVYELSEHSSSTLSEHQFSILSSSQSELSERSPSQPLSICPVSGFSDQELDERILSALETSEEKPSAVAKALSHQYNLPRHEIYSRILRLQRQP